MVSANSVDVSAPPIVDLFTQGCPSRVLLEHVTSKWGLLTLVALSESELRWSELRRKAEGVSEKMLAQTLRTLERDGLVSRVDHGTIPPKVVYSLTDKGREVSVLLEGLTRWVTRNSS